MPNLALIPALAKTLLAIAWADGELHPEEEATLKEVVGRLPTMSAKEWAIIELYLVTPITEDERAELIQHTCYRIHTTADKALALEAIDAMLRADDSVQPAEEAVARDVRAAIAAVDVSPLGMLRRSIGGAFQGTPRREQGLALWQTNPVAYLLRAQNQAHTGDTDEAAVEVAALAAGIMAQVVRVTPATADTERPVLIHALMTDWHMPQPLAEQIANTALAVTHRHVDFYRISRELAQRTSEAQRIALLDTLFSIANAADQVAPSEIDEIRVIAERLGLTRQQFITAKLKIPAVDRSGL
jgi:uncharacterized tellurite resistance protein B-like protein